MDDKLRAYTYMWEFHVKRGSEKQFEGTYGPNGEWVKLFQKGEGYLGTELHRDINATGRYVTTDYWKTQAAYNLFIKQWKSEFDALDKACESMTEKETPLGSFQCYRSSTKAINKD